MGGPKTLDLHTVGVGLNPAIMPSMSSIQGRAHGALALVALDQHHQEPILDLLLFLWVVKASQSRQLPR